MFKNYVNAALGILLSGPGASAASQGRPIRGDSRDIRPTSAARRQIDPNPTLSRQQRRYAERLATKRAKYSDAVRRNYLIPLPA